VKKQVRGHGLLQVIEGCLREGVSIDIDGLGRFQLDSDDEVVFEPNERPRVFLAYAKEDVAKVRKLYAALQQAGFEPWMDERKLLPGQNWPRAIERAIELSDFFAGCFSRRSLARRGHFHAELAYALDLAKRVPEEEIFFIPVRLDACEVPRHIARRVQYVDLFPDWDLGVQALSKSIGRQKTR
jgi:hypothetical protein